MRVQYFSTRNAHMVNIVYIIVEVSIHIPMSMSNEITFTELLHNFL